MQSDCLLHKSIAMRHVFTLYAPITYTVHKENFILVTYLPQSNVSPLVINSIILFSFHHVCYMFRQFHCSWYREWCLFGGRWCRKAWIGIIWLRTWTSDRVSLWKKLKGTSVSIIFFKMWHPRCVLITVYKEWIKQSNTTILLLLCSYMVKGS